MRAPTPAQLLQVWESGCERPATARVLLLLAAANDDADADALATLPVGRRDRLLIELHARLFRERIVGLARCPQCGEELEAALDCEDMLASASTEMVPSNASMVHVLEHQGTTVHFRLPDSRDLLALHGCGDAEHARSLLFERCVIAVDRAGENLPSSSLTETHTHALSAAMSNADPFADLRLSFRCPSCEAVWEAAFDPARFVWEELQAWALRTLSEIDLIARTYHWREADILALGPQRRRAYLEMCAT